MLEHGEITYFIQLCIEQPWKEKIKHSIDLKIINKINLNLWVTPLKGPLEKETITKIWCGLSKPVYMRACLPKQGYTPGQLIKIWVDVKNLSNVDIKQIRANLMKTVIFTCIEKIQKVKTKKIITMEKEVTSSGIAKYNSQSMELVLEVPQIASTLNGYCRVFVVSYELHIFADMAGGHRKSDICLPIVIGDVPIVTDQTFAASGPAILSVSNL